MDPKKFLDLAETLLKETPGPAECRTSIGRAYYAAYHATRDLVIAAGVPVKGGSDAHEDLRRLCAASGHSDLIEIARHLHDLRRLRNRADYHLGSPEPEGLNLARCQVTQAQGVFSRLDQFAKAPAAERTAAIANLLPSTLPATLPVPRSSGIGNRVARKQRKRQR